MSEDHSYAGQGAVLLDIGGDVGAIVVTVPAKLDGAEFEICPSEEARDAHHRPHVAVVPRPAGDRVLHSLVFPTVPAGRYDLYPKAGGPTELALEVHGGHVTEAELIRSTAGHPG